MNRITEILKILGGNTRFRIINELMKKPNYTISIARNLNLESSIVTHSLKKLENHDLIYSFRNGKLKYYKIRNKKVIKELFLSLKKLNERK